MPSTAIENYLKQAYLAQLEGGPEDLVAMGRLARGVGVTAGTATTMAKSMEVAELLVYTPRGGVRLTVEGERLARRVIRRHRLIEQLLVEVIGLDWSEVHDEAEELEHAMSDRLIDRIDALLGHPSTDPHGDPIPSAEACDRGPRSSPVSTTNLAECPVGEAFTVSRVLDQRPEVLRFLDAHGLVPGARVRVTAREPAADATTVQVEKGAQVSLGGAAAARLRLSPAEAQKSADRAGFQPKTATVRGS